MKKIGQVGWPNGFLVMSETGMFAVAAFLIGLFGAAPLAAAGIANQIAAMAFMIPLSIAQACVIRVGRSAGAENLAGVKHYGNGGIWLGCLIVVPLTLGIWISRITFLPAASSFLTCSREIIPIISVPFSNRTIIVLPDISTF